MKGDQPMPQTTNDISNGARRIYAAMLRGVMVCVKHYRDSNEWRAYMLKERIPYSNVMELITSGIVRTNGRVARDTHDEIWYTVANPNELTLSISSPINADYTFEEYERQARTTIRLADTYTQVNDRVTGIAAEFGELASLVQQYTRKGKALDGARILDEIGDLLWEITALAFVVGGSLEIAARANNAKLAERYSNGEYTIEAAAAHAERTTPAQRIANVVASIEGENK